VGSRVAIIARRGSRASSPLVSKRQDPRAIADSGALVTSARPMDRPSRGSRCVGGSPRLRLPGDMATTLMTLSATFRVRRSVPVARSVPSIACSSSSFGFAAPLSTLSVTGWVLRVFLPARLPWSFVRTTGSGPHGLRLVFRAPADARPSALDLTVRRVRCLSWDSMNAPRLRHTVATVHSHEALPPRFGQLVPTSRSRSALVVSHHLDGLLQLRGPGCIATRSRTRFAAFRHPDRDRSQAFRRTPCHARRPAMVPAAPVRTPRRSPPDRSRTASSRCRPSTAVALLPLRLRALDCRSTQSRDDPRLQGVAPLSGPWRAKTVASPCAPSPSMGFVPLQGSGQAKRRCPGRCRPWPRCLARRPPGLVADAGVSPPPQCRWADRFPCAAPEHDPSCRLSRCGVCPVESVCVPDVHLQVRRSAPASGAETRGPSWGL